MEGSSYLLEPVLSRWGEGLKLEMIYKLAGKSESTI